MDNDGTGRWRIGCRGLGNERKTRKCVSRDAVVRPVSVMILVDDSLDNALLWTHQTTVPLSTDENHKTSTQQHTDSAV